jgi:hypothetical protein
MLMLLEMRTTTTIAWILSRLIDWISNAVASLGLGLGLGL